MWYDLKQVTLVSLGSVVPLAMFFTLLTSNSDNNVDIVGHFVKDVKNFDIVHTMITKQSGIIWDSNWTIENAERSAMDILSWE